MGPFDISVETANGKSDTKVDEKWFSGERKRIEDAYTFVVSRFGRVLLSVDRQNFDSEIERFKKNLEKYHQAVLAGLKNIETDFESSLVKEYLPNGSNIRRQVSPGTVLPRQMRTFRSSSAA